MPEAYDPAKGILENTNDVGRRVQKKTVVCEEDSVTEGRKRRWKTMALEDGGVGERQPAAPEGGGS